MPITGEGDPPPRTRALAALRRVDRAWSPVIDELLAAEDTTIAHYTVLYALTANVPRSGAFLARRIGVTGATMSGVLSALAERGMIERTKDPSGGRAVVASLTPKGRDLVERCQPHVDALERQFRAEVSDAEFEMVEDVLVRWAVRLERLQEPRSLAETLNDGGGTRKRSSATTKNKAVVRKAAPAPKSGRSSARRK
jgi:DNA-binding MarR family transcriptional regulator